MIKTVNADGHLYAESEKTQQLFIEKLTWLTTEEAASYLRKTANALRVMVHRGQLRARKFRRRLYFKKIELDELLETSQIVGGIQCR